MKPCATEALVVMPPFELAGQMATYDCERPAGPAGWKGIERRTKRTKEPVRVAGTTRGSVWRGARSRHDAWVGVAW